ncbi:uncharacterized protein LOC132700133 [Cylas formicarius]|uniref:uncharacterized protein LOC132700133 n=1 Tax=Cylas formicarius TaxID=197179 RepID=UPI002958B0E5|nr:uncharacterized protein LOC132700133 [Cylas formicarius]
MNLGKSKSRIWNCFTEIRDGSKVKGICKYCGAIYVTHADRMTKHIIKQCKLVPEVVRKEYYERTKTNLIEYKLTEGTLSVKNKRLHSEIDHNPSENASICPSSSQTSSQHFKIQKLTSFDNISEPEQSALQTLFCEAVYSSNCALSMFESDKWKQFFGKLRPAFKIPDRKTIASSQLDKCYNKIKSNIQEILDNENNITLMSDGWTNVRNEGIINYMLHTKQGDFFYDFSQPQGFRHTGQYIAGEITRIIKKIGGSKITSLVTDDAANMQAAWVELKATYPNLQTYGCVSHTLNSLLKDLESLTTLSDHISVSKEIVNFFTFKHIPNAVLNEKQGQQGNNSKSLKLPVTTRWGSVKCMESVQANKQLLMECLINPEVESLTTNKIKSTILNDVFWNRNIRFIDLLNPVVRLLAFMENSYATLSDVRHKLYLIKEHINTFVSVSPLLSEEKIPTASVIRRIDMACTDTHNAAYLLDPRYKGENLAPEELQRATTLIVQLSGNKSEIEILGEISNFRSSSNLFNNRIIWTAVKSIKSVCNTSSDITPSAWWESWQNKSVLYMAASKLLKMPASLAYCERNWSTWGIVNNTSLNRLTRSRKLVYVKHNLNIINKNGRSSSEADMSSDIDINDMDSEDEILPLSISLNN